MKVHSINKDALFTIMDLGGLIHAPEDLDRVLGFLVEKISTLMETDACSLYLFDPTTETLTLKATHGLNKQLCGKLTIKAGTGLAGKTIELLKPVSIADFHKSSKNYEVKELGEEPYSSYLSVPLVYNGDPIGVIAVQNKRTKKFLQSEVDFLMTLSIPAVSLIEKAKFIGAIGGMHKKPGIEVDKGAAPKDIQQEYLRDHILKGIPAVPGIAMGKLKTVQQLTTRFKELNDDFNYKEEIDALMAAFAHVSDEIRETKKRAEAKFGPDEASIFEAYLLFLESASFQQQIIQEIKNKTPAAVALDKVVGKYMDRMALAQDEYIKERAYDIQDIARKITDHLLYGESSQHKKFETHEDTVFLNEFWSISDFVNLNLEKTKGIISPNGGASSHISILADTLNLTAVLGIGQAASQVKDGDFVIVDGFTGTVIINPSVTTINSYKNEIEQLEKRNQLFQVDREKRVKIGLDGKHLFPIGANLGMVAHVGAALDAGADMIGLYRTEFPFLVRQHLPTEEEQFAIYNRVIELVKDREVTFRTLDIGGDKYVSYLNLPKESNPALGWRAIRFSLERKDLFRIQLRAILRASANGRVRILLPMITTTEQVSEVKEVLEKVRQELTDEGVKFAKNIPLGIMIEVPAAVEIADKLAREVDYFSIGTNDLVQYCLAVDRTNPLVAKLYDPYHPAVLRMIQRTIQAAHRGGIPVQVCGDTAANPFLAILLIGLGIDGLSMIPRAIPQVKYLARNLRETSVDRLTKRVLRLKSGVEIRQEITHYFAENGLDEFLIETLTGTP